MKIKIINGANLNLLGKREDIYGELSLEEIIEFTHKNIDPSINLDWFQSNSESEIVEEVQSLVNSDIDGLVINPAGYSHTSVVIRDALAIVRKPKIEVHLTNIHAREQFRHQLLTAGGCDFIMGGLGKYAYIWGIKIIVDHIKESKDV